MAATSFEIVIVIAALQKISNKNGAMPGFGSNGTNMKQWKPFIASDLEFRLHKNPTSFL